MPDDLNTTLTAVLAVLVAVVTNVYLAAALGFGLAVHELVKLALDTTFGRKLVRKKKKRKNYAVAAAFFAIFVFLMLRLFKVSL